MRGQETELSVTLTLLGQFRRTLRASVTISRIKRALKNCSKKYEPILLTL